MYSVKGIKKGLANPRYIAQEANRLFYRRLHTWSYNEHGRDFFEADWDNMLILDACRYDLFDRTSTLPGETTSVQSRGSSTREFLRGNFDGKRLLDTVYVTASPMLYRHRDGVDVRFHEVVEVWKDAGWDETYRTVLPETVAEAALNAAQRFPDKRLLVHFLQPHYPFLGPTGQDHFDLDRLDFQWDDLASGELGISRDVVERAYEENLEEVLPSVERLLFELGGKTVVTADHGQMFGERTFPIPMREYGHPAGIYSEELVTVPWHVFDEGPRREIVAEEPVTDSERDEMELADERLRALGYLD
ncbi:hypothetical protein [Natronomonas amylolytica]|uniref:hypothetical protein n=1 Tax=Natronomonas amylolytica TaxID=3108498 RepID=UPI003008EC21